MPAQARLVMDWLTDTERRARDWQRRVAEYPDVHQHTVSRTPNGGLRIDQLATRGNLTGRYRTEDVAIAHNRIDLIHRAHMTAPRMPSSRWVLRESVTVEPAPDGSTMTVRIQGRLTGLYGVLHLLGYHDTATARALTDEASRRADFRVREVEARFGGTSRQATGSTAG